MDPDKWRETARIVAKLPFWRWLDEIARFVGYVVILAALLGKLRLM